MPRICPFGGGCGGSKRKYKPMNKSVSLKGWQYRFKISKCGRYLVMGRDCPDAGLSTVETFDLDCWPVQMRQWQIGEQMRKMNVPSKARKVGLSLIESYNQAVFGA